jgi:maltose O-acetyltransferase
MIIKGKQISIVQLLFLVLYYSLLRYLPASSSIIGGKFFKMIRYQCCRNIFKYCGKNVNIERNAIFGSGIDLCIGDNSGLGVNCILPGNIQIGKNVMMGPNCIIFSSNHEFDDITIPMINQGHTEAKQTFIEDDVWIGRDVIFTPGRKIKKGSIIAAGCVLTKDFPEYSVVGGNPSKLIKSRC